MNQTKWKKIIDDGQVEGIKFLQETEKKLRKLKLSDVNVENFSFIIDDVSDDTSIDKTISDLTEKKNLSNKGKWIYVFCANDLSILLREFEKRRAKEKENGDRKKFARVIAKAHDVDRHKCIYVGSSEKIKTRMTQHFGKVCDSTYAIRFKEWLPKNVVITCFYFEAKNADSAVLQALENGMWDNLRPIIGKKGGK